MKSRLLGITAAILLVLLILLGTHWYFGSLSNAVAYLNGDKVGIDTRVFDLGTVETNKRLQVEFKLVNLQDEPLELVGANAECSCILPPEMPITLTPFTTTSITFSFHAPPTAQQFEQQIDLYFNGELPAIPVSIVGVTQ